VYLPTHSDPSALARPRPSPGKPGDGDPHRPLPAAAGGAASMLASGRLGLVLLAAADLAATAHAAAEAA
jgi:hypothetical protein